MRLTEAPTTGQQEPYFARDSTIRRVHQEAVLILGGGRSLLMQIAHPSVARGVAEHSSYKSDRYARLMRTLRSTLAVIYGTRSQAEEAINGINRLHERVNGETYSALDPDLLVWVMATLIDTTVEMHERFLGPFETHDIGAYYEDVCRVGAVLGIPEGHMPPNMAALRRYVAEMSESLQVSDEARAIAHDLFQPLPPTGPSMWLVKHLTSGLLRPALREGFGLSWGPWRERQLRALQVSGRVVLPRLPLALRRTPSFLLPPRK